MTANEIALAAAVRAEKRAAHFYSKARMAGGLTMTDAEFERAAHYKAEWHSARASTNTLREAVLDEKNAAWAASGKSR
jgi:hypothetical protein